VNVAVRLRLLGNDGMLHYVAWHLNGTDQQC